MYRNEKHIEKKTNQQKKKTTHFGKGSLKLLWFLFISRQ